MYQILFWDTTVIKTEKIPCLCGARILVWETERNKVRDTNYIVCYVGINTTENSKAENGDNKCWEIAILERVAEESLTERVTFYKDLQEVRR